MVTTLRIKVEDQVTPYLRSVNKRMNVGLRTEMEKSTKTIQKLAKENVSRALKKSPGSTGLLVSSITTATLFRRETAQAWRVFVIGDAATYANEIEFKKGLPRNRRATGKLLDWKERVEQVSNRTVPIRRGNVIRIGAGESPYSIYSRYPQGVQFMQRAYDTETPKLLKRIDATVNKIIT